MAYIDIFNKCIQIVLKNEGGYVNNPDDPGGETNMGIARLFYPDIDIKNLTRNKVIEIYHSDYWNKMNLIGINNEDLVLQIFDFGVNTRSVKYGFNTALKSIQRLVSVDTDGIIGPVTKKAINNTDFDLTILYKQERRKYYFDLARRSPKLEKFLSGWLKRIDNTHF